MYSAKFLVYTIVHFSLWWFAAGIGGLELEHMGEQQWGMGNKKATLREAQV